MAVVLAGGTGTRLRPFTMTIPKPLLPVGDIPILEVVLRQLAGAGFTRVVIALGHMAHLFAATVGDGGRFNLCIEYCSEEQPLGTAGALRLVSSPEEPLLVMNGDILTTIDYGEIMALHRQRDPWATVAVHARVVNIDYGVVESGADNLMVRYVEKPSLSCDVSMGINVLSARCLEFIPSGVRFDMPELMMSLHRAGKAVVTYRSDCYWQDIGRFDDYQQASADFIADPGRFIRGR